MNVPNDQAERHQCYLDQSLRAEARYGCPKPRRLGRYAGGVIVNADACARFQ